MRGAAFHTRPVNTFERSVDTVINNVSAIGTTAEKIGIKINKTIQFILACLFVITGTSVVGIVTFVVRLILSIFGYKKRKNESCK